jgi:hypothetical protein
VGRHVPKSLNRTVDAQASLNKDDAHTAAINSVILTWNRRSSLKNAVASSNGVPLAPVFLASFF